MKIRNDLYLQYLDYNDRYQKWYQENYDALSIDLFGNKLINFVTAHMYNILNN